MRFTRPGFGFARAALVALYVWAPSIAKSVLRRCARTRYQRMVCPQAFLTTSEMAADNRSHWLLSRSRATRPARVSR